MQAFGKQWKNKLRQFFLNENYRIGREILKAIKCTNQYRSSCCERAAERTHVLLDKKRAF